MSVICTICARGGSVGVPGKNIALLHGKPLICHTIEQAKKVPGIDAIAVSSDSDDILNVAFEAGVEFLVKRPAALATSNSPKIPVVRHCVEDTERRLRTEFRTILDLDPTSPLRITKDIEEAVKFFEEKEAEIVITGCLSRKNPYFNMVERDDDLVARLCKPLPNALSARQQCPQVFDMNASIYLWRRQALMNNDTIWSDRTFLFEMPEERSVDIDTPLDFAFVEFLMARQKGFS